MGLMDKLRDIFTEEVEESFNDEPIKKEVIQVEIPAPQHKEKIEENFEEKPKEKKEEKPAPIFFDDNDFEGLQPSRENHKTQPKLIKKYEKPKPVEKKEEKKVFKPTPIISPVYGVLDKNYHKEDIKTKNNSSNTTYYSKDVSIDDIRKKAYGTLEDELEITLFGEPESIEIEPKQTEENDLDMFDELLEEKETTNKSDSDLFNLIDSMYEKEDDKNG